MANLFDTDQVIHSRYDIKGSWINRHADLPKRGKKVTCRHCNRKYYYQSTRYEDYNCPLRLGGHEPNVVLKDNDLTQKLRLHEADAQALYRQLKMDSDLLCDFGIMDYSLLMGVHDVEYVVGDEDEFEKSDSTETRPNELELSVNPFDVSSVMDASAQPRLYSPHKTPDNCPIGTPVLEPQSGRNTTTRKMPRGGMRLANSVVGPAYYHLGVIDILQTWTLQKRLERFLKIHFKRLDGDGLSAIEPNLYKERFQAKIRDILGIEHDEEETNQEHVFVQQTTHMDIEPCASQIPIHIVRSLASSSHLITSLDYQRPSSSRSSRSRHAL